MSKILVIDDEVDILETLSAILGDEGHDVTTAPAYNRDLKPDEYDLLILDVWLKDQNGIDVLGDVKQAHPALPVLMISGHGNIEVAVDAVKQGAFDFLEKPLRLERVVTSIGNGLKMRELSRKVAESKNLALERDKIIGNSPSLLGILESLDKLEQSEQPLVVTGEAGSGKSLLARHMFYRAERLTGSFTTFSCRVLPKSEISAALFGKESGGKAQTGKLEECRGLLHIQGFGLLGNDAQGRLIDALETGSYSRVGGTAKLPFPATDALRLVFTSRSHTKELLERGQLREDFVYKLSQNILTIPPLRERKEDVSELLAHFAQRFANELGGEPIEFSPEAFIYLESYPWPGNVRELENLVERINMLSSSREIDLETLKTFMASQDSPWQSPNHFSPLKEALKYFERSYILYAVQKNNGNITRAARELNIERTHLYRKLRKLGLQNARSEILEGQSTDDPSE